ncbi:MAG: ABC transporter ATP-binding protein, partial [Mesorhizobium sp.]
MMSPDKPRPMVSIDSVTMSFGTFIAVQNVNLTVADGEF